jgi:hypothetical protein
MKQRLSTWLALRCKEAIFQTFLGVKTETEAVTRVRVLLGVKSRAEVDKNPETAAKFHQQIRLPFSQYQQDNPQT